MSGSSVAAGGWEGAQLDWICTTYFLCCYLRADRWTLYADFLCSYLEAAYLPLRFFFGGVQLDLICSVVLSLCFFMFC